MARPREFDTDTVIEKAMQAFWAKGYAAASLDDLCEATGLNRSSLYAAFGDKRALLFEALDRYGDQAVTRFSAALAGERPIRKVLAAMLDDMVGQIAAGPGRRGCFLGNCAAEVARQDRGASQRVRRNLTRVEAVFLDVFTRAQARGEFGSSVDVRALSRFFVASIQGLRVIGKTAPDRRVLDDIVKTMLRCLDG